MFGFGLVFGIAYALFLCVVVEGVGCWVLLFWLLDCVFVMLI